MTDDEWRAKVEARAHVSRAAWQNVQKRKEQSDSAWASAKLLRHDYRERQFEFGDTLVAAEKDGIHISAIVATWKGEPGYPSVRTCELIYGVACEFPPVRRRKWPVLSLEHFKTVADIESHADQEMLLDRAVEFGWSRDRLRAEAQPYRMTAGGERPRVVRRSRVLINVRILRELEIQPWAKGNASETIEEVLSNVLAGTCDLYIDQRDARWPKRAYRVKHTSQRTTEKKKMQ